MSPITPDTPIVPVERIARHKGCSIEAIENVAKALGIEWTRTTSRRRVTSFRHAQQIDKHLDKRFANNSD